MCKNKETKTIFINTFVNINIYSPADDWLFMKVRSVDKIAILPLPVVLYLHQATGEKSAVVTKWPVFKKRVVDKLDIWKSSNLGYCTIPPVAQLMSVKMLRCRKHRTKTAEDQ